MRARMVVDALKERLVGRAVVQVLARMHLEAQSTPQSSA